MVHAHGSIRHWNEKISLCGQKTSWFDTTSVVKRIECTECLRRLIRKQGQKLEELLDRMKKLEGKE